MKHCFFLLLFLVLPAAGRPNVLFLAVDDLRPELASFGAEYIHSPAMDALAASGRAFHRHYVQAPTCGASRYALLAGRYARTPARRQNGALFDFGRNSDSEPPSLPAVLRGHGYRTVAVGKISHHPGGLGGPLWNDPAQIELPGAWDHQEMPVAGWKNPMTAMHGYAHGKGREKGVTPALEHEPGDDNTYTDGWIAEAAVRELGQLAKQDQPFFLAVGLMKPHLPFASPQLYRERYGAADLPPIPHPDKPPGLSTWHGSSEFFQYHHANRDPRRDADYADELRRSYAACVSYADAQIAKIMARLEELGLTDSTVVVLWGDHGFHLGEHAVWGKHTLFEESLRSPLIIRTPGMAVPGRASRALVETIDLYPTLARLCGAPLPEGLDGRSLEPLLADPAAAGRPAISYTPGAETIRTDQHRLVRHRSGQGETAYELYDHQTPAGETRNVASEQPERVQELAAELERRLR